MILSVWALAALATPPPSSLSLALQKHIQDAALIEQASLHFAKFAEDYKREMKLSLLAEKSLANGQGIERPKFDEESLQLLLPSQQLEWRVRGSDSNIQISVAHLRKISDVDLLDEGLWSYLLQQIKVPFDADAPWNELRSLVKEFLGQRNFATLLEKPHGEWWRWLKGLPISRDTADDPRVAAVELYFEALKQRGMIRVQTLIEARYKLFSKPISRSWLESFDISAMKLLEQENKTSPSKILQWIEGSSDEITLSEQKIAFLESFSRKWKESQRLPLFVEAEERIFGLRLKLGQKIDLDRTLDLVRVENDVGHSKIAIEKARLCYEAALKDQSRVSSSLALYEMARATEGLAKAARGRDRNRLNEWAVEYTRRALDEGTDSRYRDILIESYGELLSQLGYANEATEAFETLFRAGTERLSRLKGLKLTITTLERRLDKVTAKERGPLFDRFISLLSFFSKAEAGSREISPFLKAARTWAHKLKREKEGALQATLEEIGRASRMKSR